VHVILCLPDDRARCSSEPRVYEPPRTANQGEPLVPVAIRFPPQHHDPHSDRRGSLIKRDDSRSGSRPTHCDSVSNVRNLSRADINPPAKVRCLNVGASVLPTCWCWYTPNVKFINSCFAHWLPLTQRGERVNSLEFRTSFNEKEQKVNKDVHILSAFCHAYS
jgi:hypothetical protein